MRSDVIDDFCSYVNAHLAVVERNPIDAAYIFDDARSCGREQGTCAPPSLRRLTAKGTHDIRTGLDRFRTRGRS